MPLHRVTEIEVVMAFLEPLFDAGARLAFDAADAGKRGARRRMGSTLRPGPATPLWNWLEQELASELKAHGSKARLARVMGVPRQTVHAWCKARSRMPDAERTLQLLAWLVAKRQGREPM